jgi:DNA-binding response OmpR family regulator
VTPSAQDASPRRILLVEDDAVAAHFAVQVLAARGGFDVVHTPDPAVALKRASSEYWDLVLTDVELPGMTGLELVRQLRLVAPDLPVAVMTAHDAADAAMRMLRSQADEFLQKPIRPAHLLATVTSLVARGRAARLAAGQAVLAIGAHPGDVEIGAARPERCSRIAARETGSRSCHSAAVPRETPRARGPASRRWRRWRLAPCCTGSRWRILRSRRATRPSA